MGDIGRIVQRFALKRGDISDLLSVKKTIDLWGEILRTLQLEDDLEKRRRGRKEQWKYIDVLRGRMLNLETLSGRISDALAGVNESTPTIEEEEENALAQDSGSSALPEATLKWAINPT